jgi:hypothetical protein
MNPTLAQLAQQSGITVTAECKKFAELIVRECLNVMSKTSEEADKRFTYMGDDVPTVVHQMNIEKHFGVEE